MTEGQRKYSPKGSLVSALLGGVSLVILSVHQSRAQYAAPQDTTPVPPVSVTAPASTSNSSSSGGTGKQTNDGSAAAGYRVDSTNASGPVWGNLPIQDAPYSITVVPSALLENTQADQPEDIWKLIPQATNFGYVTNQDGASGGPSVRGFGTGLTIEGVQYGTTNGSSGTGTVAIEDKEAVSLLAGVSGFLYGNSPDLGGNIDFQLKRPTPVPYYALTVGDNAGANGYIHADLGGPLIIPGIDPGIFGYRLNLVGQDGHTSITNQTVKRDLLSGAFDIHLPWNILVQLNASHNMYQVDGLTPITYASASLNPWPAPTNPSNFISPDWTGIQDTSDTGGVKVTWKPNDIFTVRSNYQFVRTQIYNPGAAYMFDTVTSYSGAMTSVAEGGYPTYDTYNNAGYTFLDMDFSTYGIRHKITTGFSGYSQSYLEAQCWTAVTNTTYANNFYDNIANQFVSPATHLACGTTPNHVTSQSYEKNYFFGDQITTLNDNLIILAGANYTATGSNNFSAAGETAGYGIGALTPTVSAIYKIQPWLSAYATYQQAVQNGTIVTSYPQYGIIYTNAGAVLPAYLGIQYEGGLKATVGENLLLTADYFHMTEQHIYSINNSDGTMTDTESGNETHQGVEVTATGKLTPDLTLFGGFTAMDPRIEGAVATPWQNGQLPAGVSPISGKLYVEYTIPFMAQLPPWIHDLTLVGGFQYVGPFNGSTPGSYAAIPNIIKLPGYTLGDLGFRYETGVYHHPLILRFNVTNITNKGYYTGTSLLEGPPRTFLATAEVKW